LSGVLVWLQALIIRNTYDFDYMHLYVSIVVKYTTLLLMDLYYCFQRVSSKLNYEKLQELLDGPVSTRFLSFIWNLYEFGLRYV